MPIVLVTSYELPHLQSTFFDLDLILIYIIISSRMTKFI